MTDATRSIPVSHDVLAVLIEVGAARDAFHAELVGEPDIDAGVIAAVLAAHGRVSATLGSRRTLIALSSILRSLHAWQSGLIDLDELASGCAAHAAATERFANFGSDVRIELRTLDELLQSAVAGWLGSDAALRSQITMLDRALREWFERELFGETAAMVTEVAATQAERAQPRDVLDDIGRLRQLDGWSRALLADDEASNLFTGLAGSCWRHGWVAVPVEGDQLGDAPDERARFAAALADLGSSALLQIDLAPQGRWRIVGRSVVVIEPLRMVHEFEVVADGIDAITAPRRGNAIVTDEEQRFAVVERDEHHVVAGPRTFVERYLAGQPLVEAWAQFREYVEEVYAGDEEPPSHLLDAARDYPRASRRGMGAQKL